MGEPEYIREHCLIDVLASKHYPQVFQVTRPYVEEGKECLKPGQFITVLQRKKVELITGTDADGRYCKVRKDRQTNVEVLEEERIVYSLSVVAEVALHIEAVEFRKEIRYDKHTFEVGERFTVEKVGKNFRGRTKNICLRRMVDGKVHRFPLDVIGMFKLLTGKTLLPLSRILSLRSPPLKVRFPNIHVSSNFPPGIITLEGSVLCDLVYILIVTKDTYQYEVFSIDSDIFVEKTDLKLPKPIRAIIPNGIFVNSVDYNNVMKAAYKHKLADIDAKIVEDMYSNRYYGSASIDKNPNDDSHLLFPQVRKETATVPQRQPVKTKEQPSHSKPNLSLNLTDPRPAPMPRYSKKYRATINFPAIKEYDNYFDKQNTQNFQDGMQVLLMKNVSTTATNTDVSPTELHMSSSRDSSIGSPSLSGSESGRNTPVSPVGSSNSALYAQVRKAGKNESLRSRSSEGSCGSRIFYSPVDDELDEKESTLGKNDNLPSNKQLNMWSANEKFYESPSSQRFHERIPSSSSITTEDSGDSGVVLSFRKNDRILSRTPTVEESEELVRQWNRSSGQVRQLSIARTPNEIQHVLTEEERQSGLIQVDIDIENSPKPPVIQPRMINIYQNIHYASDHDSDRRSSTSDYHTREHPYEELPYQNIQRLSNYSDRYSSAPNILQVSEDHQHHQDAIKPSERNMVITRHLRNEIARMGQSDVARLLGGLNLHKYVNAFARELINGQLLLELEEDTLRNDLRMSWFEARKLHRYLQGWRAIKSDINGNDPVRSPQNKIENWSVNTVVNELKKINSDKLAMFCKEHEVDGPFLKDLIEQNLLSTLRDDHGVTLNGIELSRLKAFVLKAWRPDRVSVASLPPNDEQGSTFEKPRLNEHKFKKASNHEKKYKPIWNKISQN